jgi:hypothetical protein
VIKIVFAEPASDKIWKRWRKDCEDEAPSVTQAITDKRPPAISDLYKRKRVKQAFYASIKGLFRGKCAYCETYVTEFQKGDIEHYRPKLGVTDEDDAPIKVDYGWGPVPHWGYFWLAYDWRNLLFVCADCNQPSKVNTEKVGKHNRFPVVGTHAKLPEEIAAEQPLLLNPLVDDPQNDLEINTTDGMMQARAGSTRGEKTIAILGLNIRDRVRERRLTAIREARTLFADVIGNPSARAAAIGKLRQMQQGDTECTAAVRAYLDELKPFIQIHL